MTDTATVETLTAEVRVLMVGNRQVTLSVYRQLDEVGLSQMDPFGRINDGKRHGIWVVGRHRATGALVTSPVAPMGSFRKPIISTHDLNGGRITICGQDDRAAINFHGRTIEVEYPAIQYCKVHPLGWHTGVPGRCDSWDPNGFESDIKDAIEKHDQARERHRKAAALPLIVLAGLR